MKNCHMNYFQQRQTTKLQNAFANNVSTDIKFSKAQIYNIIQSGGSFGSWLANFGKKVLTNIAVPLARDNLPGFASNLPSNAINKLERKNKCKGIFKSKKRIYFILNEDMNDITKIIKSLEDSSVLIDGVTETGKDEIKKQEGGFLGVLLVPLAASLVQPVISSVVKGISERVVRRAGRGNKNKKCLEPFHPWNNIEITNYLMAFYSRNNLPRIKDGAHIINLDDENS